MRRFAALALAILVPASASAQRTQEPPLHGQDQVNERMPPWQRGELTRMGYKLTFRERSMGPITAVLIDPKHGTFWGAAGNHGEDHGIGW